MGLPSCLMRGEVLQGAGTVHGSTAFATTVGFPDIHQPAAAIEALGGMLSGSGLADPGFRAGIRVGIAAADGVGHAILFGNPTATVLPRSFCGAEIGRKVQKMRTLGFLFNGIFLSLRQSR